jgi:glycosyltransferase involved in cell wall biosynthesis
MEVLAGFAARLSGLPWIFTERSSHGAYPDGWRSRLHIQMGRMATAIVANSAEGERFWAERGASGVPRRLIPNALPIAEIASTPPAVGDHLNVAPDRRIVLFVGRFSPEKNLSTLVRALSMVSPHLNIIGVLAGVGPDHEKIAQEAKALNMGEQIRLPGYVNNVWGLMKKADVFVSPAFFEGRPNTVLEAMACGCPLILSDIPAHRELVSGEAALFTKADRPEELAQAISRTLEDPSAATARARVARNIVDRYTVDRMAKDYDSLYRTIAAGRTDSVAAERRRAPIQ